MLFQRNVGFRKTFVEKVLGIKLISSVRPISYSPLLPDVVLGNGIECSKRWGKREFFPLSVNAFEYQSIELTTMANIVTSGLVRLYYINENTAPVAKSTAPFIQWWRYGISICCFSFRRRCRHYQIRLSGGGIRRIGVRDRGGRKGHQ